MTAAFDPTERRKKPTREVDTARTASASDPTTASGPSRPVPPPLVPVAANAHVAPATTPVLRPVQEQPGAKAGCALPYPRQVRRRQQLGGGPDDGPQQAIECRAIPHPLPADSTTRSDQ